MKKALILTYYFPPSTATAGYRPLAWAANLHLHGWSPTVITRHWEDGAGSREAFVAADTRPPVIEDAGTHRVIRLPYPITLLRRIGEQTLGQVAPLRKLYYLLTTAAGRFNIDMDADAAYRSYLEAHLKEHAYDVIIATAPPFSLFRLASHLGRRFGIPWVADFRDLWNNEEMRIGHRYSGSDGLMFGLIKRHICNWLRTASLILVTRPTFAPPVEKLLGERLPTEVLLNGYEESLYGGQPVPPPNPEMTISCIGTIYPEQDLEPFAQGIQEFIARNPEAKLRLRFIGLDVNPQAAAMVRERLPAQYLHCTGRVPRAEAIRETLAADILYYPAWRGYDGVIATKIFDYMASHKNLLIAPGDDSSIDALVRETGTGAICNGGAEVCRQLETWYAEWRAQGRLNYSGSDTRIRHYSREQQTEYLAQLLDALKASAVTPQR